MAAPPLPFRFYLITDRLADRAARRPAPATVLPRLVAAGLRAVQVREKDLSPADLARFCEALLAALPAGHGCALFLNDRADLALSLGLAGVHLREDSLPLARHAPLLRAQLRYGVSTHSPEGVRAAEAAGAAFATFGPVYETPSKAGYGPPVGLHALEQAAARTALPLLALGGVTPARARDCLAAGAWGVAAISAVWAAPDPVAALARFEEALGAL
ncbi:MAG: thiamine phosphate synthase [Candidatus Lambdaproteobacteria bacterium]|nr:thiamine phosphate synthase [Candidatus Lambdaproteobacteria bacterium]